jgi:hypothetical protein
MGMQSDQLADILFQQEVQGKTAKELRALGKEELAERLEAQTLQDRLNAAIEKMQNLFVDLASGLTPVLFVLGKALSIVGLIAGMIQDLISGVGMLFGMDMPESSATVGAFKSLFGLESAQSVQDGIAPPDKGPFTITDNYGATAITTRGDGIAVSPNINQGSDNTEAKRTNQYLQELIKLSARPSIFQIGTDEFYTRTAKYSYQVQ